MLHMWSVRCTCGFQMFHIWSVGGPCGFRMLHMWFIYGWFGFRTVNMWYTTFPVVIFLIFSHSARNNTNRRCSVKKRRRSWKKQIFFLQGPQVQKCLRSAETKQEELHGSCSQITTTSFLLLSNWFYLYGAKYAHQNNTHANTHTHRCTARNASDYSLCMCSSLGNIVFRCSAERWFKCWKLRIKAARTWLWLQ